MSFDELKSYATLAFQAVNVVATCGVWLYVRYGDRNKEIDRKFDELETVIDRRLDMHSERIAAVETQVRQAPTHADLAALHEKVNKVANSQARIEGELKVISENLRLMLGRVTERGMQ